MRAIESLDVLQLRTIMAAASTAAALCFAAITESTALAAFWPGTA
jgi:hypothetical protein